MRSYFLGTHEATLLSGGQMSLPAKIRRVLNSDQIVLSIGFEKCVFGFSVEGWDEVIGSGFDKPVFDSDGRLIRRQVFASAEVAQFDNQGRFSLPTKLREYAGLKSKIVVIGAGDHFEIWDVSEWNKMVDQLEGKGVLGNLIKVDE